MNKERVDELITVYRDGLLLDTVPFWLKNGVDRENGGFFSGVDRKGNVIDTDKSVWVQGRFIWLLSTLYNTVEHRDEWLDTAALGAQFLRDYCFDSDGRMFFQVTKEGNPLRKRRYLFTECFGVAALSAYGMASGEDRALQQAIDLFKLIIKYYTSPDLLPAKVVPDTRQSRSIGMPMMILNIAQELRAATGDPVADEWIDRSIGEIKTFHLKDDPYTVLETVGIDGSFQDHFEGRKITPGHIIEAAWFILDEARKRGGATRGATRGALAEFACRMIDWAWEFGWDGEHGGFIYFRDVNGLPGTEYWHDMKFWWQQNEAIIATLLAYYMTRDEKYAAWHKKIHEWTYARFPDPDFGEWYGYLHRDGRVSTTLKGNLWKGPYHIPRMQWYCWRLLEELRQNTGGEET